LAISSGVSALDIAPGERARLNEGKGGARTRAGSCSGRPWRTACSRPAAWSPARRRTRCGWKAYRRMEP